MQHLTVLSRKSVAWLAGSAWTGLTASGSWITDRISKSRAKKCMTNA
jgi:hypothetical protein